MHRPKFLDLGGWPIFTEFTFRKIRWLHFSGHSESSKSAAFPLTD